MDPTLTEVPRAYFAYLLRLWQVNGTGPPIWRASLEDPHTRERQGFPDLERLCAFLEELTLGNTSDQERRET